MLILCVLVCCTFNELNELSFEIKYFMILLFLWTIASDNNSMMALVYSYILIFLPYIEKEGLVHYCNSIYWIMVKGWVLSTDFWRALCKTHFCANRKAS